MNDMTVADKLAERGPGALNDAELIAVIMRCSKTQAEAHALSPGTAGRWGALEEYARRRSNHDPRAVISDARAAAGALAPEIRAAMKEHMVLLCLNARRQLVKQEVVSVGTLSASLVHPREIFGPAIAAGSAAVVVLHNHPSGDTSPSAEDRECTRRLQRAGELLGIPLADHVIVSESSFYSFREHGLL